MTSGYKTVDEMNQINFSGDIHPEIWYERIKKENGKTDLLAVSILANICYWYRPITRRDEQTDKVLRLEKKFKGDLLQKQYSYYANTFGQPKSAVKASMDLLENYGLITREFRNMESPDGTILNNRMYIHVHPDKIRELTFVDRENKPSLTLSQKNEGASQKRLSKSPTKKGENTSITSEITPTTTDPVVVDEKVRLLFEPLKEELSDKDILKIYNIANKDTELIKNVISYVANYRNPIGNLVGFIISGIENKGYNAIPYQSKKEVAIESNHSSTAYTCWSFINWDAEQTNENYLPAAEKLIGRKFPDEYQNKLFKVSRLVQEKLKECEEKGFRYEKGYWISPQNNKFKAACINEFL